MKKNRSRTTLEGWGPYRGMSISGKVWKSVAALIVILILGMIVLAFIPGSY